ncbi:hypothetical protein MSG28_007351 [Choristoneura fumiferana]|uniref:Uncharacterized protein n=1 Tax=Choristoneura fumiferana TaxID=7141 RepID=A0ACC0JWR7_CHOFU|nr:hypothetical protein MSG28_007351 [Choristoneura fumiferana]
MERSAASLERSGGVPTSASKTAGVRPKTDYWQEANSCKGLKAGMSRAMRLMS